MVPTFWIWVRKIRRYGRQLREYVVNMREMCQCHGACFVDVGGTFRGYGKQLREYRVNMQEMCQRHGAYFLDVGKKKS
jgi:uncharacterized protein (DUF1330 family)